MWCPRCKAEYVDGYTRCDDCEVDLVANAQLDRDGQLDAIAAEVRAQPMGHRLRSRRRFGLWDTWKITRPIFGRHGWSPGDGLVRAAQTGFYLAFGVPAVRARQAAHLGRITREAFHDARPLRTR